MNDEVTNPGRIDSIRRWNTLCGAEADEDWRLRLSAGVVTNNELVMCDASLPAGLCALFRRDWLPTLRYCC